MIEASSAGGKNLLLCWRRSKPEWNIAKNYQENSFPEAVNIAELSLLEMLLYPILVNVSKNK